LTLGPGLLVRGGRADLGVAHFVGGAFTLTNRGTILADVPGQTLTVVSTVTSFSNQGIVRAENGGNLILNNLLDAAGVQIIGGGTLTLGGTWGNSGNLTAIGSTLTLGGTWSNSGSINYTNSVLNVGGTVALGNLGQFNRSGGTVNLTGSMNLNGGTLNLNATSGSWVLANGTLSGGTLQLSESAALIITSADGRLSNMTVNGNLDLSGADALLRIAGVVTLNGIATLSGSNARVLAEGHATLQTAGGGQVVFSGTTGNIRHLGRIGAGSLTLEAGLLVQGGRSEIGTAHFIGGAFVLTNRGAILANVTGQTITAVPLVNSLVNQGTLRAENGGHLVLHNLADAAGVEIRGGGTLTLNGTWGNSGALTANGSTLTLGGTWSNAGSIRFTNSVLNIGGTVALANLGQLHRSGGTVNLTGTLNLGGGTLNLNATSGSWVLANGTVSSGTIQFADGSALLPSAADGRLSNVTVNGDLNLSAADALLRVAGLVTLNGVATLSGSNARLLSEGNTTLQTAGGGQIVFGGTTGNVRHLGRIGAGSLTLSPGLVVRGGRATLGEAHFSGGTFTLTNQGTILANVPGQPVTVANTVSGLANAGTLRADNGTFTIVNFASNPGTLIAGSNGVIAVTGLLPLSGSSIVEIQLAGLAATQFGRITATGAATLNGTLNVVRLGGYTPNLGDRFRFMTFASRNGLFSTTNGFTLGGGLVLSFDTSETTDLELVVGNP
jgi:fibronectin-binding autotransporter adhesin